MTPISRPKKNPPPWSQIALNNKITPTTPNLSQTTPPLQMIAHHNKLTKINMKPTYMDTISRNYFQYKRPKCKKQSHSLTPLLQSQTCSLHQHHITYPSN
ncbi:hypothetical protein KC19_1G167400 [Ceratodon purpureus]|uniref:Uncharacterized protein n=1 Tax=Ceratodon purpureus TaxID=3225 RepID=A0A8T0J905_CERPU|nr:hypothetical protein KC19_1G167400 [Ceratodon purpureus]